MTKARILKLAAANRNLRRFFVVIALLLILVGVLSGLLSLSGGKCKLETDGPLAIRFVGVRPDQGDDLFDGDGERIGSFEGMLMRSMSWGRRKLRRDFIFEIPETNEPVYFLPAEQIQPSDGGEFLQIRFGAIQPEFIRVDSRGQFAALTATIPDNYLKGIFGHFNRWYRTNKVDIRLRYLCDSERNRRFAFNGPFSNGVKVKAAEGKPYELTAIEDDDIGRSPMQPKVSFLVQSSAGSMGDLTIVAYDRSGGRHIASYGSFMGRRGASHSLMNLRVRLSEVALVAAEKPFEVRVQNVRIGYRDHPIRDHAEYLDVMAERLGLSDRAVKQLLWYRFRNWKEALNVIDIVRGQIHVKAVAKHLTNLTRDELDNLDDDSRDKIRKAALRWLEDSSVFADGIAVGLACGWDEFFDLAMKELSHKRRIFSSTSTQNDILDDVVHKAAIADVLQTYPVEMNAGRVFKLKELLQQTDNADVRESLIDCLGASPSEAANDGLRELAQDDQCWIWWPATAKWYERNGCEGSSCDKLPIKMKVRLMLVKDAAFDEQLEAPLRRLAGEVLTPVMLQKSGNLAGDVLERITQRVDEETAMRVYEDLLVRLQADLGQKMLGAEAFYVYFSGKVVSKIARQINVRYGGNIGGLGTEATEESNKLEPKRIHGVTGLISEVLKWYESNKDAEPIEQERM